jgi:hypothetical protein
MQKASLPSTWTTPAQAADDHERRCVVGEEVVAEGLEEHHRDPGGVQRFPHGFGDGRVVEGDGHDALLDELVAAVGGPGRFASRVADDDLDGSPADAASVLVRVLGRRLGGTSLVGVVVGGRRVVGDHPERLRLALRSIPLR